VISELFAAFDLGMFAGAGALAIGTVLAEWQTRRWDRELTQLQEIHDGLALVPEIAEGLAPLRQVARVDG
jgi:hypothetical protein